MTPTTADRVARAVGLVLGRVLIAVGIALLLALVLIGIGVLAHQLLDVILVGWNFAR